MAPEWLLQSLYPRVLNRIEFVTFVLIYRAAEARGRDPWVWVNHVIDRGHTGYPSWPNIRTVMNLRA